MRTPLIVLVLAGCVASDPARAHGRHTVLKLPLVPSPVALGSANLTSVETLTEPDGHFDKQASAAFDREGRLWVAFASMAGGDDVVVVRNRKGKTWSVAERLDAGDGVEGAPKLVVDGSGRLWAFWHGKRDGRFGIYGRRRDGNRWAPEQRVSPAGVDSLHPQAVHDETGGLWIAWEEAKRGGFRIRLTRQVAAQWAEPVAFESPGSDRRPSLSAAKGGGIWIAFDSTRSGNYDVWLCRARANTGTIALDAPQAVTQWPGIDDSPSLATAPDGSLWVAFNSMRANNNEALRTDRNSGGAFVRVLKDGRWWAPPTPIDGGVPGQISGPLKVKTPRDAVDPYWHWKATQNYPSVFFDRASRAWVIWRAEPTGAHNFGLFARIHSKGAWSKELALTEFSPGRDEFPSAAMAPDGGLQLAWEGQVLPKPGDEARFSGGDVDSYNTLGNPNVILTGRLVAPTDARAAAELAPTGDDATSTGGIGETRAPGPEPRTARTTDGRYGIYFGDPHSHTVLSDAKTGFPDQILTLSRDQAGLDFAVVSDHAEMGRLLANEHAEIQATARAFTEDGRFVSLAGWEWTAGPAFGHRVILHPDDGLPALSSTDPAGDTIEKLYDYVRRHPSVLSPHHTANATWGRWNPDAAYDEGLEPNFEIASWHGRFEYYGNPREGRRQVPGHQYQDALRRGRHVGVMAASDTHHLAPGEGGVTAVLATSLDRASIFDALRNRRNYATTGARIVLEFTANEVPMGARIESKGPVEFKVRVEGTSAIDRVEIVRNLIDHFAAIRIEQNPRGPDGVFLFYDPATPQDDSRLSFPDMSRLTFRAQEKAVPAGETSYYVRVTQADGQQAWSSPIWVRSIP